MTDLKTELKNRNEKLQRLVKKNNFDAYVVTDADDIWYLTNIEYSPEQRPFILIAYPDKKPLFIVPKLEESHVDVPYLDYDLAAYFDVTSKPGDNWYEVMQNYVATSAKVGIEDNSPLSITANVQAEWVTSDLIKQLRMIKSDYEVAKIEKVAKLTASVVQSTLEHVKAGTTVAETAQIPFKYYGAELAKFTALNPRKTNIVWPAAYSYMPHSIPAQDAVIGS